MSSKAREMQLRDEAMDLGLRFDFNAISRVEEQLGLNLLDLDAAEGESLTGTVLRGIVHALHESYAFVRDEEPHSLQVVGSLMHGGTMGEIMEFLGGSEGASEDADPPVALEATEEQEVEAATTG